MVLDQQTSRRNVLKTLGAAAAGTVAFTGSASAATDASYYCAFHMPMLFDKSEGTPLQPEPPVGTLQEGSAGGIVSPSNVATTGCGLTGCSAYVADIPWLLHWTTDADASTLGEVYFSIEAETPANDLIAVGDSYSTILDSQNVELRSHESVSGPIQGKYQIPIQGGDSGINLINSENYFRPIHFTMELDFRNSDIRDGTVTQEFKLCTPNKPFLSTENLIGTTADLYDTFVKAADTTVPTDLERLRKAGRLYAYAGATGGLDLLNPERSNLPYEAMRHGISAFQNPIDRRQARSLGGVDDAVTTMGGPAMIELDEEQTSTGCSGPPAVTGDCPTDPDGDGLYEDVNGDGAQNLADAGDLFQNRNSPAVQNNVDAYDFSGNGQIDLADTVDLFNENSN